MPNYHQSRKNSKKCSKKKNLLCKKWKTKKKLCRNTSKTKDSSKKRSLNRESINSKKSNRKKTNLNQDLMTTRNLLPRLTSLPNNYPKMSILASSWALFCNLIQRATAWALNKKYQLRSITMMLVQLTSGALKSFRISCIRFETCSILILILATFHTFKLKMTHFKMILNQF